MSESLSISARQSRQLLLKEGLKQRVLVIDGAMGTAIQNLNLNASDFGGDATEGCNEFLVITRPYVISKIHEEYLQAGADIIETNTFGSTALVLDEFGLKHRAQEITLAAGTLARKAADKFSTKEKPRFVAGSIGPTTKSLSVTGGVTFDQLIEEFKNQASALYDAGVDYYLIETCQDTRNIKAAILGIEIALTSKEVKLPIAVSGTIETMGTMLAGQTVEALTVSLMHKDLLYLGLNCATGPSFMADHLRSLATISPFPIACVPNAGLPDEEGRYLETPSMMSQVIKNFGDEGWINLIGGCCGTTKEHIKAFADLAPSIKPRTPKLSPRSYLSGIDFLEITEEIRPVLVGERTNVIGSRKFKNLIQDGKFDEASEIGKKQIKNSAQIIDICLANPDRDELSDMISFLELATKKISAPLMIDSTDPEVIEKALTYSQGKAIINSINLEDGEERFEQVCPLALKYGAALVVGCIDDDPLQGMGVTVERKVAIAKRSFDLLTKKYGIKAEDIYWDALVFPCGTGDENYKGSAVHTIDGVRALKENFPGTKTVLGISNISFGLPEAGREVLNSVFLYHCVKAGLDLALVNTEKIERYAQIPEDEIKLCDDLLWNRGSDPIAAFNSVFGIKKNKKEKSNSDLPLEERLPLYILEGTKDGLEADINEALKKYKPLEIINGPLMKGMDEVGRLFNENKLIVAEVLQSAEAMKAAVAFLEPHMEKNTASLRGRVLLATVKGDVHDIGKNLVDIILSNNGFEVINLGIKIPPQELIEATKKYEPEIIGLSGLLVKSAQQMVSTVEDFTRAGISTPVLVGGAALSRNFVDLKIAPAYTTGDVEYASDAMHGLELAKQIVSPPEFASLKSKIKERRLVLQKTRKESSTEVKVATTIRSSKFKIQELPLSPPDFERHTMDLDLDLVWKFINPLMLLGRHLGVKGNHIRALQDAELRAELKDDGAFKKSLEILGILEEVKKEAKAWMKCRGLYQFFPAYSEGNKLIVESKSSDPVIFEFLRQAKEDGLCLSDLINPKNAPRDALSIFFTTATGPVREVADQWKEEGKFLKSHVLLALALETAEGAAEYLHSHLRSLWGFADGPTMSMMDRFQTKYRGRRYSFGYPACPRLEDQELIFKLLKPESIGIELTEGFMMSPESSVSALAFSHPDATYFAV